jgi:hypothetical protein
MITDSKIIKDGKEIKKVSLMFISEETRLCDGCDEMKKCASIITITNDVVIICKDCLTEIVNEFND